MALFNPDAPAGSVRCWALIYFGFRECFLKSSTVKGALLGAAAPGLGSPTGDTQGQRARVIFLVAELVFVGRSVARG